MIIKGGTPSAWGLVAAESQGAPPPVVADPYWDDISLQVSARLTRLEEEQKLLAVAAELRQPLIRGRAPPRPYRLVLMVAAGAILFAAVAYVLLKVVSP